MKFKIFLKIFVFLLTLALTIQNNDEDFDIQEDDNVPVHDIPLSQRKSPEEDDEFDNPTLLKNIKGNADPSKANRVGIPHQEAQIPQNNIEALKDLQTEPTVVTNENKQMFSIYEIFMGAFVVMFLVNLFIGVKKNEGIAESWYKTNKSFFEDNYAHIGMGTEYNTRALTALSKISYSSFQLYTSGRVHVKWLLAGLDLRKRHDLVSVITNLVSSAERDRLTFETSIVPANDLTTVFTFSRKKDIKTLKKNYLDIGFFTKTYAPYFVNDKLIVSAEDIEVINQLFNNKGLLNSYRKIENYIDIIYFTDLQTYTKEQHALFFSFDVEKGNNEAYLEISKFVHLFIDELVNIKLNANQKKECEKMRVEFEKVRAKELNQKNDQSMTKRQEVKMKQREEKLKGLTVEQKQKLDEKERKEQLKKQKQRTVKVLKK